MRLIFLYFGLPGTILHFKTPPFPTSLSSSAGFLSRKGTANSWQRGYCDVRGPHSFESCMPVPLHAIQNFPQTSIIVKSLKGCYASKETPSTLPIIIVLSFCIPDAAERELLARRLPLPQRIRRDGLQKPSSLFGCWSRYDNVAFVGYY